MLAIRLGHGEHSKHDKRRCALRANYDDVLAIPSWNLTHDTTVVVPDVGAHVFPPILAFIPLFIEQIYYYPVPTVPCSKQDVLYHRSVNRSR